MLAVVVGLPDQFAKPYYPVITCPTYRADTELLLTSNHFFLNTWRPKQNGRHFADDIFKRIFLNENCCIVIKISLKFVPKCPINHTSDGPCWNTGVRKW